MGLTENDGTHDIFPRYPEDTDFDFTNVNNQYPLSECVILTEYFVSLQISQVFPIAEIIKNAGNDLFKQEGYKQANAKYEKALRYLNKMHECDIGAEIEQRLVTLEVPCLLNR